MLAIAAFYDYDIWQMDVKTAFLNRLLKEELYMMQSKGFANPTNADKVCTSLRLWAGASISELEHSL